MDSKIFCQLKQPFKAAVGLKYTEKETYVRHFYCNIQNNYCIVGRVAVMDSETTEWGIVQL